MRLSIRFGVSLLLAGGWTSPPAIAQTTERDSVDSSGAQVNDISMSTGISGNGRFVAFVSFASTLVPHDTNGQLDCFVHDRLTGAVTRVSVRTNGAQANDYCRGVDVSDDGTTTAFFSGATNLVYGDTNSTYDVFVHDALSGTTSRVSVDSSGNQGDGPSGDASISADGSIVAFDSSATNLVSGDTNGMPDVFVHDRTTGLTTRVSLDSIGQQGNGASVHPHLSPDGRYVVYYSDATNLVAGDGNGVTDGFIHDRVTGITERVTVDSGGNEGTGASYAEQVSADGSIVSFTSFANDLDPNDTNPGQDVFIHDRNTGSTQLMSTSSAGTIGTADSYASFISADGAYLVFASRAANLVAGDTNGWADVFRKNLATGETIRVSVDSNGIQADDRCHGGFASDDGRYIAFYSRATTLVANDTNGQEDVFVHDCCVPAAAFHYGSDWPGTLGAPTLAASAPPVFGTTFTLSLTDSASIDTVGVLLVGFGETSIPTTKDGTLCLLPVVFIPLSVPKTGASLLLTSPPTDPALCGFEADLQALELDSGASRGMSFTDGLALVLGI